MTSRLSLGGETSITTVVPGGMKADSPSMGGRFPPQVLRRDHRSAYW